MVTNHQLISQQGDVSACKPCPAGVSCPSEATTSTDTADDCPLGYYCPEGTSDGTDFPCPPGR